MSKVSKPIITRHLNLTRPFILLIIFALVPVFVRSPYYLHLLIMVGMNAILAMTFVLMLRTGLINLGVATFWGVGAYSSALLVMRLNLPFWLSLPMSTLIAGTIAFCVGYLLVRNPGFSFVIMTAVIGLLLVAVIGSIAWLGGYAGIPNIPPPDPIRIPLLPPIEFASEISYYYLMLFLFLLVVAAFSAFYGSWTGRAWTAIGLNSQLAASLGINNFKYRLLAFVVGSATTGLIGSFYAHYQGFIAPNTFGLFKTIYVHVYAVLGGLGFPVLGPVVGSFVMIFFPQLMRITSEVEPILTGMLLILLIVFLPNGILSLPGFRAVAANPRQSVAKIGKMIKSSSSSRQRDKKA